MYALFEVGEDQKDQLLKRTEPKLPKHHMNFISLKLWLPVNFDCEADKQLKKTACHNIYKYRIDSATVLKTNYLRLLQYDFKLLFAFQSPYP